MIDTDIFEAFTNRLVSITELRKLSPSQLDRVKQLGSAAENLLTNKDFVLFIRQFQLENIDAMTEIISYTADDNAKRVALTNHFNAINEFINLLKRQVVLKNRVVSDQNKVTENPNTN